MSALPTFFIPHGGGPCFFMDWDPPDTWNALAAWLRSLAGSLPAVPKAVVVISGHWEEDQFTVTAHPRPPLLYDYSGFPEHTYRLEFPAPGSPDLALEIVGLLQRADIPAATDPQRGFDHGVFIPFKLIYPDAEIPVVQLSLRTGLDPAAHLAAGRALEPLRSQGVLLVSSGMSYHNLRGFFGGAGSRADAFDAWLTETVCAHPDARDTRLENWRNAPSARDAHPREEHLLPLMVAAGAASADSATQVFHDRIMAALISAYRFG